MSSCHDLNDWMPAVARGEAAWSPAEAAHLAGCAECRDEYAVVRAGASAGAGAVLDVDRLTAGVLERLRTEPMKPPARAWRWVAGLAAAAVLLAVLLPRESAVPAGAVEAPVAAHVPGLDGLGAGELAEVLEVMDTRWTDVPTIDAPSLDDLDPQELERLERPWES